MSRILLLARTTGETRELQSGLIRQGFACSIFSGEGKTTEFAEPFDLLLVEFSAMPAYQLSRVVQELKHDQPIPVIALAAKSSLNSLDALPVDDFIIGPYNLEELSLRIKRLLVPGKQEEPTDILRSGHLVLDKARCEITLDGKVVDLTFKEYELLKFLMESKGHVLTRQVLLNEIWGYDYFGGDRTVDVHVRRLRSKIEDPDHTFIETVRNIGYRFKTAS